jgi:hypothetical protein
MDSPPEPFFLVKSKNGSGYRVGGKEIRQILCDRRERGGGREA